MHSQSSPEHDLELANVGSQAMQYLHGYSTTRQTGYYTTAQKLDYDRYVQNKSILKNWCESGDRAACELLVEIQKLESTIVVVDPMQGLIG
jgi:hypothetical protein